MIDNVENSRWMGSAVTNKSQPTISETGHDRWLIRKIEYSATVDSSLPELKATINHGKNGHNYGL